MTVLGYVEAEPAPNVAAGIVEVVDQALAVPGPADGCLVGFGHTVRRVEVVVVEVA
jgi:hypothetical protein